MIIIIALLFVFLLIIPLVGAGIYYKKKESKILLINQKKIRDPRYFGKSFANLIEMNLFNATDNTIILSKPESFLCADHRDDINNTVEELVIARKYDYVASNVDEYKKEVYGGKNIIFYNHKYLKIRAAYSKENMIVGSSTDISRWIDADGTLAIYDNCNLGISASSRIAMSIGRSCSFRRLYAPEIKIGQYPGDPVDARDGKNPKIYNMPIKMNKEKRIENITSEMIDEEGVVGYTIISKENLRITENIIIQGDVRSNRGIRLNDGAVVCGNVFAEEDIYLGKNACILGNVFSQENIYLEEGAVIGQKGRICSVIARNKITFEKRNFVFGYVSCEKRGLILPENLEDESPLREENVFLKEPSKKRILKFKNLNEYQDVDKEGFRNRKDLEEVIVPKGATTIAKSMFFNCTSLKKVDLPFELKRIMSYSFADCNSLKDISLSKPLNLEIIGTSAFENCESLLYIEIPNLVKSIGGAAFAGCSSLKKVSFMEDSNLLALEDHSFNGCRSLEEIEIPKNVEKIGVSAFRDCINLTKIVLPRSCEDQPGIVELDKEKLEFYDFKLKDKLVDKNE